MQTPSFDILIAFYARYDSRDAARLNTAYAKALSTSDQQAIYRDVVDELRRYGWRPGMPLPIVEQERRRAA